MPETDLGGIIKRLRSEHMNLCTRARDEASRAATLSESIARQLNVLEALENRFESAADSQHRDLTRTHVLRDIKARLRRELGSYARLSADAASNISELQDGLLVENILCVVYGLSAIANLLQAILPLAGTAKVLVDCFDSFQQGREAGREMLSVQERLTNGDVSGAAGGYATALLRLNEDTQKFVALLDAIRANRDAWRPAAVTEHDPGRKCREFAKHAERVIAAARLAASIGDALKVLSDGELGPESTASTRLGRAVGGIGRLQSLAQAFQDVANLGYHYIDAGERLSVLIRVSWHQRTLQGQWSTIPTFRSCLAFQQHILDRVDQDRVVRSVDIARYFRQVDGARQIEAWGIVISGRLQGAGRRLARTRDTLRTTAPEYGRRLTELHGDYQELRSLLLGLHGSLDEIAAIHRQNDPVEPFWSEQKQLEHAIEAALEEIPRASIRLGMGNVPLLRQNGHGPRR